LRILSKLCLKANGNWLRILTAAAAQMVQPKSRDETDRLGDLPALEHGEKWVGGFHNIVEYLKEYSQGAWDLDRYLSPVQQADCFA
jgi:hypothetical protein